MLNFAMETQDEIEDSKNYILLNGIASTVDIYSKDLHTIKFIFMQKIILIIKMKYYIFHLHLCLIK